MEVILLWFSSFVFNPFREVDSDVPFLRTVSTAMLVRKWLFCLVGGGVCGRRGARV